MKKILLSVSMIAVVAVVVMGATGAFFSDTETSTGNTFTAGAIDLKVDSTQHYNGMICEPNTGTNAVANTYWWRHVGNNAPAAYPVEFSVCGGTWTMKDLVLGTDQFFNFGDIKPGDSGEDTISLHVLNNDAYVCAAVSNLTNLDNGTTGPEGLAADNTSGGDLQQAMDWKVWNDNGLVDGNGAQISGAVAGDNIYQTGEKVLTSGHPTNGTLALYDSTTGTGPLLATGTAYLGVSWSLPAESGNETQTDSMTGDISFNVVQSRNNGQFVCGGEQAPEGPIITQGDLIPLLANQSGAMRVKGQNGEGIYLGEQDLGVGVNRVSAMNTFMNTTGSHPFTLTYNATTKVLNLTGLNSPSVNLTWDTNNAPTTCTAWNVLRVTTRDSKTDAGMAWSNVMFNATSLGNFGTVDSSGTPGYQHWSITGLNLTSDWTLTGDLDVANFYGNESLKAEITMGCSI